MKKFFLLFSLLFLASCASAEEEQVVNPCPGIGFMEFADSAAFFANAAQKPTPDDVAVYATMRNLAGACESSVNERIKIEFAFDLIAQKNKIDYPATQQNLSYFVAVLGPGETVLQRQNFYVTLDFGKEVAASSYEEQMVDLPLAAGTNPQSYNIVVGFALTPEQLSFNKAPSDVSKK